MEHVLKRFLNALILILLKSSNGGGKKRNQGYKMSFQCDLKGLRALSFFWPPYEAKI